MKKRTNRVGYILTYIYISIIIVFTFILIVNYKTSDNIVIDGEKSQKFYYDWIDDNKNPIKLNGIGRNITAYNKLPDDLSNDKYLCFRSKNVNFKIYLYGECIYTYAPEIPNVFGKSSGSVWHFVDLPKDSQGKMITIELNSIYNDASCFINNVVISDSGSYILKLLQIKMAGFLICITMVVLGALLMYIDIALERYSNQKHSLMFLGCFSIVCSLWSATETMMLQLIMPSALVHLLNYFVFMLIPFPVIGFINVTFDIKNRKTIYTLGTLAILTMVIRVLLNTFRILDYHESLFITQLMIIFTIVILVICLIINSKRLHAKRYNSRYIDISVLILILTAIIDMVRYNFNQNGIGDASQFLRMGMVAFIIGMGTYVFKSIGKSYNDNYEAKLLEKLAYMDGLTDLENKSSFIKYMRELSDRKNKCDSITIIQFDINNLKPVNDNYGHLEGDNFIRICSQMINESFGAYARCFRTGGDEFVVIISKDNAKQLANQQLLVMMEKLNEYNDNKESTFKLEVACGMATYHDKVDSSIYDVLRQADNAMYSNKRKMKKS